MFKMDALFSFFLFLMKKLLSLFVALALGFSAAPAFAANENAENALTTQGVDISQNAKKQGQNLNKLKRMKLVQNILDSRKECRNMHGEDKSAVRDCFREKVKNNIVERTKRLRETAKSCREEGVNNVKECALQKYLNVQAENESASTSTEENTASEETTETDSATTSEEASSEKTAEGEETVDSPEGTTESDASPEEGEATEESPEGTADTTEDPAV